MRYTFFIEELFGLFFPRLCQSCGQVLFQHEKILCTSCLHQLPKTWFHHDPESKVDQVFWGRCMLEKVSACYYYARGSKVQNLVHSLKYRGVKAVGTCMGELYGSELKNSEYYKHVDVIIPVPLHPRKKRQRGFNQSEVFARGLGAVMEKPIDTKNLRRRTSSSTQTRKSRFMRWKNVEGVFILRNPESLDNRSVLLVDDVITTGATIEACAHALNQAKNLKIYVAAIGFASS